MKGIKIALSAVAVSIALAGCSSTHSPSFDKTQKGATKITGDVYDELSRDLTPIKRAVGIVYEESNIIDVDNYTIVPEDKRELPKAFDNPISIDKKDVTITLQDLASVLYVSQKILIDTSSPDLDKSFSEDENSGVTSNLPNPQGVTADITGNFGPTIANTKVDREKNTHSDGLELKPFAFRGTVRELLDYTAVANNIKWRYDEKRNRVYFFKYEIRKFFVHDFSNEQKYQSIITNKTSSDSNGTSAGSTKSLTSKDDLNPWADLENAVNTMKSPKGIATFDARTGMVVVRDNDYVLSRIEDYIESLNDTSTREVIIEFRMINAKVSENNYKGVNVNYLNGKLHDKSFGSFSMDTGIGTLSPDIPGGLGTLQELASGNYLTLANDTFSALMGMISEVGTAKVDAYEYVSMMNNDTYANQNSKNREYISSMEKSSSSSSDGRDNISTEKDVAVDGLNISIKSRVIDDRILLDYSIASSMFDGFVDAGLGSGLEGIKLKNDSTKDIKNKATLKNGETRILIASSKTDESTSTQGLFDDAFWWFGGDEREDTLKDVTFVTVTAYYNN
jgi:hypothetical protein